MISTPSAVDFRKSAHSSSSAEIGIYKQRGTTAKESYAFDKKIANAMSPKHFVSAWLLSKLIFWYGNGDDKAVRNDRSWLDRSQQGIANKLNRCAYSCGHWTPARVGRHLARLSELGLITKQSFGFGLYKKLHVAVNFGCVLQIIADNVVLVAKQKYAARKLYKAVKAKMPAKREDEFYSVKQKLEDRLKFRSIARLELQDEYLKTAAAYRAKETMENLQINILRIGLAETERDYSRNPRGLAAIKHAEALGGLVNEAYKLVPRKVRHAASLFDAVDWKRGAL